MDAGSIRIAMWSGPRNISTAMMRAWGNRSDTAVIDEPFYAYYLKRAGKDHPMAAEVIAAGETNWRKIAEQLTQGPIPGEKPIFFQKQMTHHLLPEIDRDWITGLTNCFLIRDPREVILSYIKKNRDPELEDLGFVQQCEIFDFVRDRCDSIPPVIDADDVLRNPERILRAVMRGGPRSVRPAQCCRGRRVYATPMGFGQSTGTTLLRSRRPSSLTNHAKEQFRVR